MEVVEICFHDHGRVTLIVQMPETEAFTTANRPHVPRLLFRLFPQMASQRCFNGEGHSFRREAQATEIPHLLEHLIIEIQNQVRRGIGLPLSGETRWNWTVDPRGRFYVTVDYDNEIIALAAIRLAENVLNAVDSRDMARLDMPREIARLREIARRSRRLCTPPARRQSERHLPESAVPAAPDEKAPASSGEEAGGVLVAEAP